MQDIAFYSETLLSISDPILLGEMEAPVAAVERYSLYTNVDFSEPPEANVLSKFTAYSRSLQKLLMASFPVCYTILFVFFYICLHSVLARPF